MHTRHCLITDLRPNPELTTQQTSNLHSTLYTLLETHIRKMQADAQISQHQVAEILGDAAEIVLRGCPIGIPQKPNVTNSTRALGVRARNVHPCSNVSRTLRCTLVYIVSLRLEGSQFALSVLSRRSAAMRERICMARFQSSVLFDVLAAFVPIFSWSRVLFDVLAAFVPISLGPPSFRSPRIVRRHVLLSCQ